MKCEFNKTLNEFVNAKQFIPKSECQSKKNGTDLDSSPRNIDSSSSPKFSKEYNKLYDEKQSQENESPICSGSSVYDMLNEFVSLIQNSDFEEELDINFALGIEMV